MSPPVSHKRVLVVDDSRDVVKVFCKLLSSIGYQCAGAYDGEEAVKRAETFRPDAILLDIQMPRLDGFEACRLIREFPLGKRIVILACTAAAESMLEDIAAADFDGTIVKPVKFAELAAVLAAKLAHS